ncbi:MAG: pyridoxal-phosphate dependent enzyme [Balneolaceae bacterium]|nr:pyridoxal-phosphate dependent enzyme [Balneolaceae bacterium]
MPLLQEIADAHRRLRGKVLRTPLVRSRWLSGAVDGEVWLKLESEQHTGSFKARGALNKLLWLREQGVDALPVTASTGNHGQGFARALHLLGMEGKVFLPRGADESKAEAISSWGAVLEYYAEDPYETEVHTRQLAEEKGWVYVSPYNDLQVVAGQGTIAAEIWEQGPAPDTILATVGGGGLISGLACHARDRDPEVRILGAQPENSPEMAVSVRAPANTGRWNPAPPSPTGSAGGFERNAITFDYCRNYVDQFILVPENEIEEGIRGMIARHHKLVEGSAAVAVAALLREPERFAGRTTAVVICGANIATEKLKKVICG